MAHKTIKSGFHQLSDRLNQFPQGAPPSDYLFKILSVLMNEKEASLMSRLPIKPFSIKTASKALRISQQDAEKILTELASRALLLDLESPEGDRTFVLPPPMAGFFEFSLMRYRHDIDQKLLSELFYQYLNVEEDFVRDLFVTETKLGRIFVNEQALNVNNLHILDYERTSEIIKRSTSIAVGICYCRHKMTHLGKACAAPLEICMTFGSTASSLIKYGHAREVQVSECMSLLEKAYDHNLVQIGENQQEDLPFICNCCGCCCEALLAIKKFGTLNAINTTNFLPEIKEDRCNGCGRCVLICPVGALSIVTQKNGSDGKVTKNALLNAEVCLGCGICIRSCNRGSLTLKSKEKRVITPINSVHRIVLQSIEQGKLQNLIFDNQAQFSHRAMAAILGAILKMPPIKQIMASEQMKSNYLLNLVKNYQG